MFVTLYFLVYGALVAGIVCCLRLATWAGCESEFWFDVDRRVRVRPELDPQYQQLLAWAKAHRPAPWRRILGWRSPDLRRDQEGGTEWPFRAHAGR